MTQCSIGIVCTPPVIFYSIILFYDSVVNVASESNVPVNETVMTCAICMDDFDQVKFFLNYVNN